MTLILVLGGWLLIVILFVLLWGRGRAEDKKHLRRQAQEAAPKLTSGKYTERDFQAVHKAAGALQMTPEEFGVPREILENS